MSRSGDGKCPDIGTWCSYPREICEGTCCTKEYEDLRAENAKLREEIERLKAALKPVLVCSIEKFMPGYETYAVEPFYTSAECGVEDAEGDAIQNESIATALNAIREAQRIYNGGAK